jgi:hypothetical protein
VFLDVDGVLNRLTDEELCEDHIVREAIDETGRSFTFRVREQLLDALDELLHRPGVAFGWLTSWGTPREMEPLLADYGPFAGRLWGGFIWEEPSSLAWRATDWKLRAIQRVLAGVGEDKAFIWADDQMHEWVTLNPIFRSQMGPRLLVQPNRAIGIHPVHDVERMRAFIVAHTSAPAPAVGDDANNPPLEQA